MVQLLFQNPMGTPLTDIFWRTDGTFIDVEIRGLPQLQGSEKIGYVITFSDITARQNMEEQI